MRTNGGSTGLRKLPLVSFWGRDALALFVLIWPQAVSASSFFLGENDIVWSKLGYVVFMSLWGALAALLHRFSKGQDIGRRRLIALRDVVNATLASFLTFLICDHFNVPPALAAVAFTLAGYGGARFMEWAYQRLTTKAGKLIDDA